MNKAILILYLFLLGLNSIAQVKTKAVGALISGSITDYNSNIKVGETIIFANLTTAKVYETVSNDSGQFELYLTYGFTYLIKIKGFNVDIEYSTLSIPKLKPNESSVAYQVDIQFEPGKEFILENVYFDFAKATIKRESFEELDNLVSFMKTHKKEIIEIGGHTDNVGDEKENKVLSLKRSEAIVTYLTKRGIDAKRVKAVGYGEEFPIASNETDEGRKLNRRTEVKIITSSGKK
jgi:OmpA-OmpF porin, OOP family